MLLVQGNQLHVAVMVSYIEACRGWLLQLWALYRLLERGYVHSMQHFQERPLAAPSLFAVLAHSKLRAGSNRGRVGE